MKYYLAALALLFAFPVAADDHVAIVEQAFANISHDYHENWAFTESETEDGVTTVGRYDPRLPNDTRWTLLSIEGRVPTADEIDDYRDDREDEFHDDDDDNEIDFIDFDTLKVVEETDEYWLFNFVPDIGDEDDEDDEHAQKFMQNVSGTLRINRDGYYLEYINMRNEKPIRPVFSVKISRFLTHLTFAPAAGNGPIVPMSIDVQVKGRAALFIKFDEVESTHYSDYEFAGS